MPSNSSNKEEIVVFENCEGTRPSKERIGWKLELHEHESRNENSEDK